MTRAYNELYIDDAMSCMGEMLDYAVCDLGYDPDEFFSWFIASGIAGCFERGNPRYVTGMSGFELAGEVLFRIKGERPETAPSQPDSCSPEYWAGWVMAYYQWYRDVRFAHMVDHGLTASKVLSMYILHEADVSKFAAEADALIQRSKAVRPTSLQRIRKAAGMTQKALAEASGVTLRMIQLYEQRQNDIASAQFSTVMHLAKALGCSAEALVE